MLPSMRYHGHMDVRDNPAAHRFEVELDGHLAVADYRLEGTTMVLPHVGVPPELEGRGIGSALAKFALDEARARGLKVVPSCPFVASYIQRHPAYQDLVAR